MGKFNTTSVVPGQVGDIQRAAIEQREAELQQQQPAAESTGSAVDDLLAGNVAPEAPAAIDPGTAEAIGAGIEAGLAEQERSTVPTLTERSRGEVAPVKWDPVQPPPVYSTDGGVAERAKNLANTFANNSSWEGGLAIAPSATVETGGLSGVFAKAGAIANQEKVQKPDGSMGFQTQLDQNFLMVGAAVTENVISRLDQGMVGVPDLNTEEHQQRYDSGDAPLQHEIGKMTGNVELGKEIHREYQRIKNAQTGQPTDQYTDLSSDEAAVLGDAFKEMYAKANPNDFIRITPPGKEGHVTFQITPEGAERINSPAALYKRSVMFPGVNVRPSKAPIRGGQLKHEVGRVATRRVSSKLKERNQGTEVLDEAMDNMATVPNVVNKQRMRVLFATVLPALALPREQYIQALESDPVLMAFATINNIGKDQLNKLKAQAKAAEANGAQFDIDGEFNKLRTSVAQSVRAVAMERNGANYLSYYMQAFNGRIAPQQTYFDPTSSKAVRFVTTNAVPAKATPGSRINRNLRQMYAMMLVKDADALLPEGREAALVAATPQLEAWGDRLQQVLNDTLGDNYAEEVAAAIEAGTPLTDPNFPKVDGLKLDPEADADLLRMIQSKGEDGPHFIDGLIDFANYIKANRNDKPYFSYFNAYMDGKTNGIASNGIQMGSRDVAFKTGVLRTNPRELLDDGLDVRVALCNNLMDELNASGLQETDPNFYTLQRHLYTYKGAAKDLAKGTTMTFGYGKELASFVDDIAGTIQLLEQEQPEVAAAVEAILASGGDRESMVETIHAAYVNHLGGALSEEALEARPLMRGAATLHALADKVFKIKSATGYELALGGSVVTGTETISDYKIDGQTRTATRQVSRDTALASKGDQGPGTRAYGGSLPGPVQSIDAATVAMTASGKSWKKLTDASMGNPYLHTIYDAFKVDAMGYDVVLDEVNQNWLDAGMNWSYLEATQDATTKMWKEFNQELKQYPDALPLNTDPDGEHGMFLNLTEESENHAGELGPWALSKILRKTLDIDPRMDNKEAAAITHPIAKDIIKHMKAKGYKPDAPTYGDLKLFLHLFTKEMSLNARLTSMVKKTNHNKKRLAEEIRRSGVPNYQYYAH